MTSVFGIPLDRLDYLTDDTGTIHDVTDRELSIFVGGRYNQFHDNILLVFGLNTTEETKERLLLSTVYRLISILPPLIIILCQIGFALAQSGAAKYESAAVPFFANMIAFAMSTLSYFMYGYTFSQTDGFSTFGYHYWFSHGFDAQESPTWLLGFALALTTTNIATYGGVDRCPLLVYVLLAPMISGVVHGMSVHWGWHPDGWLLGLSPFTNVKYQDFGGSGIIHVVGGASALALSVVLGPRYSRIRGRKSNVLYNDLDGHSVPTEMLGGYLLCVCYTCINCSRVFQTCLNCSPTEDLGTSLINTLVAAGSSCLFTVLCVVLFTRVFGRDRVNWPASKFVMNGIHVGMVAVAAGCNVYPHFAAVAVGASSALGYVVWSVILYNGNNDDPVGVAAVHLGGGLWGLVCVYIFEETTGLVFGKDILLSLMGIAWNLIGGLTLAAFSALATVLVIVVPKVLNMIPLSHEQELQGLDTICVQQDAYSRGNKVTTFNTDHIEDRERYGDESPVSTNVTNVMSPTGTNLVSPSGTHVMSPSGTHVMSPSGTHVMSPSGTHVMSPSGTHVISPPGFPGYTKAKPQQEVDDIPYFTEITRTPSTELAYIQPMFFRSPSADTDRRLWFNKSGVQEHHVLHAPESPLIDYHYTEFGDAEL